MKKIILVLAVLLIESGCFAGKKPVREQGIIDNVTKNIAAYTDKKEYAEGETVYLIVKNNSPETIRVPASKGRILGGIAEIEMEVQKNNWIVWNCLYAVPHTIGLVELKPGNEVTYQWLPKYSLLKEERTKIRIKIDTTIGWIYSDTFFLVKRK